MSNLEMVFLGILVFSHIIFLSIVITNYFTAPRISNKSVKLESESFLSILIPARNEEKNIPLVLDSILNQTYRNYEIIVLNDQSNDRTREIVEDYTAKYKHIKMLEGQALPKDWLGKNWACYQLSQHAKGEYNLFLDADVTLSENALSNAVKKLNSYNASMLTVFPTQKISGFGEWLIVPLMNWLLLTFLPLGLVHRSKNPNFIAANGQFILIKRDSYLKIGTHELVKNEVVEDMELARAMKRGGYKIITAVGSNSVQCRMYSTFGDAVNGFSKNFYRGFNISRTAFLFIVTLFMFFFAAPVFLSIFNHYFISIILMILAERIIVSAISVQNMFVNLILHPLQMILMFYVGIKSALKKNILWKGRSI